MTRKAKYADVKELGRGGMSTVREVVDQTLLRSVAMKVLDGQATLDEDVAQRFVEEAQITGQLEHPSIIPVYELGTDDEGERFLCMKLVRGQTLEEEIEQAGECRLEPDQLARFLQIFIKVCDAIAFAHSRDVIHRDLKPSNVMVGDFGQVYVMDWGIARKTAPKNEVGEGGSKSVRVSRPPDQEIDEQGALIGTPNFMAPEQVHHDPRKVDSRTDVFALGALLYAIITGSAPYTGPTVRAIAVKALVCDFPIPSVLVGDRVPMELELILLRAMAEDPADRYQTVASLQRDVERFLRGTWHLPTRTFRPGDVIVAEGDQGDEAYIIVEGRCRVLKKAGNDVALLRELRAGDVFGETAVLSEKPRTASVEAIDDVMVMVVTRESMGAALGLNAWVGPFIRALAERFREVDGRLRELESRLSSGRRDETV